MRVKLSSILMVLLLLAACSGADPETDRAAGDEVAVADPTSAENEVEPPTPMVESSPTLEPTSTIAPTATATQLPTGTYTPEPTATSIPGPFGSRPTNIEARSEPDLYFAIDPDPLVAEMLTDDMNNLPFDVTTEAGMYRIAMTWQLISPIYNANPFFGAPIAIVESPSILQGEVEAHLKAIADETGGETDYFEAAGQDVCEWAEKTGCPDVSIFYYREPANLLRARAADGDLTILAADGIITAYYHEQPTEDQFGTIISAAPTGDPNPLSAIELPFSLHQMLGIPYDDISFYLYDRDGELETKYITVYWAKSGESISPNLIYTDSQVVGGDTDPNFTDVVRNLEFKVLPQGAAYTMKFYTYTPFEGYPVLFSERAESSMLGEPNCHRANAFSDSCQSLLSNDAIFGNWYRDNFVISPYQAYTITPVLAPEDEYYWAIIYLTDRPVDHDPR